MNRRVFLAASSSAVAAIAVAAPVPKPPQVYDLLLIDTDNKLLRVPVRNGKAGKLQVVVTLDERLDTPHRIHADRYVITPRATVIDLTSGKVIHQPKDAIALGVDGNRVIYRVEKDRAKPAHFAFDLTKQTATQLDKPGRWELPDVLSPDGSRSVTTSFEGVLTLHTPDGKSREIARGFRVNISPVSSFISAPPVAWADDDHVITQTTNGKLVTVNVADGKQGDTIVAAAKAEVTSPPTLVRDAEGNMLYDGGLGLQRIDVKAGKATKHEWHQHGHQFESAIQPDVDGFAIRHAGKLIGSGRGIVTRDVTAPDHMAFIDDPEKGGPPTVRVWNADSGRWVTLEVVAAALVGWVKG